MRHFHVIVILGQTFKASRDKTAGIISFAGDSSNWEIHFVHPGLAAHEYKRIFARIRPDGVIAPAAIDAHRPPCCPRVFFDSRRAESTDATLDCDNVAIGREAANILLGRGFRHFAFIGNAERSEKEYSNIRYAAFADAVRRGGGDPKVSRFDLPFFTETDRHFSTRLGNWLRTLPKPCGLLVYQDFLCQILMVACRHADITIPGQIGVIGVDNEIEICEKTNPTLSSIEPDFFGAGYRAAELLDQFMRKGPPRKTIIQSYGIKRVCERMSSRNVAGPMKLVEEVRERIRLSATEGLTASALAAEFHMSLRMLEYRFRSCLGTSVREELVRAKLDAVKRLLTGSDVPIGEIAFLTGFGSANHLKAIFRSRFNVTMREWRAGRVPAQPSASAS